MAGVLVTGGAGFIGRHLVTRLVARSTPTSQDLSAVCLLVYRPVPFQRGYLAAPWGPVFSSTDEGASAVNSALRALTERLRAGSGRAIFVRIEPRAPATAAWKNLFLSQGYVVGSRNIQPKDTRVIDLTKTEDDLLRAMHPKTRYNIRVARRHGVQVEERTNPGGLKTFLTLAQETERRGRFHYHPKRHYEAMLDVLGPARLLHILIASYRGIPLAVHLLVRFGSIMTYAHGASSEQRKSVMAPHLLHWEGMLRAKAQGVARFDLFGIAQPEAPASHPWFGISRFKEGFGGAEEHYIGASDLVCDTALYRAYEIGRGLRGLLQ